MRIVWPWASALILVAVIVWGIAVVAHNVVVVPLWEYAIPLAFVNGLFTLMALGCACFAGHRLLARASRRWERQVIEVTTRTVITRTILGAVVVSLVWFVVAAITFEKPQYVRVDGYGRVPAEIARSLEQDGCTGGDAVTVCTVAWSAPCANRLCLAKDASWIGLVVAVALTGGLLLWRRIMRGRRAGTVGDE